MTCREAATLAYQDEYAAAVKKKKDKKLAFK
jgi:hypothetical protein